MIKSMTKANILLLTYFNGVLPDNSYLILKHYPFFKSETKIQNAIKTLNEEKLIKKIRIPNYPHQSNNQKDAYIITAKGQKELFSFGERIGKKVYKRSQKIEQQLKNQQYDMLNRLTETTLLLESNEHFISRSKVYDLFPEEITKANQSLRFHGAFKSYDEYMAIYNIKSRAMEARILDEEKFFRILNGRDIMSVEPFKKILIADDEKITDKLIKNRIDEPGYFTKSKRSKYIFHPERQNEITYLITLNSDPDDVLFFLHFDKLNMQEFKEKFFLSNSNAKEFYSHRYNSVVNETFYNPMLFFEIGEVFRLYSSVLGLEHNQNDIIVPTLDYNAKMLNYLFEDFDFVKIQPMTWREITDLLDFAKEFVA